MTELLRPEPWTEDAVCAKFPGDAWFSDSTSRHTQQAASEEAIAVCRQCPVQTQCLDYALRTQQDFGIWGATTVEQRKRMRRGAA